VKKEEHTQISCGWEYAVGRFKCDIFSCVVAMWRAVVFFRHFQAQRNVQNAALRFERACSQLTAAKEMVNLAEQGYFTHGQPFDPAWQEMLNHGTMKVCFRTAPVINLACEISLVYL
jgi:SH3 domain-binding protein 5 (SH3BP5)